MKEYNKPVKKKGFWKVLKWLFLLFIVVVIIYYSAVVFIARSDTPAILAEYMNKDKIELTFEDLSPRQLEILLKVQDPNFFGHSGVDLSTPGAGITTLTQGLGKRLYFDNFRPGIAKIKLMLISYFVMDSLISKQDQISLFLNYAILGFQNDETITGFASASRSYFHKEFDKLTDEEFTALVAMLIAPGNYNPKDYPEANQERVSRIHALVNGEYEPKGLMDLYYGGEYPDKEERGFFKKLVWGY